MSNELQEVLDTISRDKETNLLPENLKTGVTCLGVTGTHECPNFDMYNYFPAIQIDQLNAVNEYSNFSRSTFIYVPKGNYDINNKHYFCNSNLKILLISDEPFVVKYENMGIYVYPSITSQPYTSIKFNSTELEIQELTAEDTDTYIWFTQDVGEFPKTYYFATTSQITYNDVVICAAVARSSNIETTYIGIAPDGTEFMGTLQPGLDTSDADATAEDIRFGKYAYVDGQKIMGIVGSATGIHDLVVSEDNLELSDTGQSEEDQDLYLVAKGKSNPSVPLIVEKNSDIKLSIKKDILASKIGLVPEKIVSGSTILGVEGTAERWNRYI